MDLTKLHLTLVRNKAKIIKPLQVLEVLLFILVALGFVYYFVKGEESPRLISLGNFLGEISFILYAISLLPGIIGRFRRFQILRSILIVFRRHIGINAFILGILHMGLVFAFPVVASRAPFFDLLRLHEIYGFIILILFFPLWLTANDFSVKKLGRQWKTLHSLTYIAVLFIFLHIATSSGQIFAILAFLVLILEIFSWIYVFILKVREKSVSQSQGLQ